MKIEIKKTYGTCCLKLEADNVTIEETLSEGLYAKKEDGKEDYSKRIGEDVTDEAMTDILRVAEDLAYYRQRDFDSSNLIRILFDKLPQSVAEELIAELHDTYL